MAEYTLQPSPLRVTPEITTSMISGEWTPTLSCTTPGDLSITYLGRLGRYFRYNQIVILTFAVGTVSFTHSTASGSWWLEGVPFAVDPKLSAFWGSMEFKGITKANYTQFTPTIYSATPSERIFVIASGSGQAYAGLSVADMPSGGTPAWDGTITYIAL